LGFDTSKFGFCDVFSTDDWAVDMVPKPVKGVVLLYPHNDKQKTFRDEEAKKITEGG